MKWVLYVNSRVFKTPKKTKLLFSVHAFETVKRNVKKAVERERCEKKMKIPRTVMSFHIYIRGFFFIHRPPSYALASRKRVHKGKG